MLNSPALSSETNVLWACFHFRCVNPFFLIHSFLTIHKWREGAAVKTAECTTAVFFFLKKLHILHRFRLKMASNYNFDKDQLWRDSEQAWGSCQAPYSKNMLHPLLTDNSKQKRSSRAGVNGRERKGREEREQRAFSFSVAPMTQIFHRLQNLPPQEACLFEIQQQARRLTHVHSRA